MKTRRYEPIDVSPPQTRAADPGLPLKVLQVTVDERGAGQRLDNFLGRILKDVPRSHIFRVIRKGEVRPQQVALREPAWPPHVIQVGNAFHNQLELPVLFYVVTLLALVGDALDVVLYVLSWMFVLSRLVHAYIHVTSNRLDRRTAVFLVGAIALALMWVIVIARIVLFVSD